jgi:hypothetical protein
MKTCNKCGIEKELNGFYIHNNKCKECKIIEQKVISLKNKDLIKEYKKEYRIKNKNIIKNYMEDYYSDNKTDIKDNMKFNYLLNKDSKLKYQKEYNKNNKENRNAYATNRKKIDNLFRLTCAARNMIYSSLNNKGYSKKSHTYEIIGCSYEFLLSYLEGKFETWMNYDNKGLYNGELNYGWDIDHIIPLSSAKTEEELLKLNHYSNLQPLCSKINRDIKKDN